MPYWRLMYDWDNNYTKKEKRMILLTQEAIDKINWLTPWWWAWATFVTQEEYDALPSSKLTDGIEYIIVDAHCQLLDYWQLIALWDHDDVLTELNTCPEWYFYYVLNTWISSLSWTPALPSWKYYTGTSFSNGGDRYSIAFTNLTVQELVNLWMPQAAAEDYVEHNWEWTYSSTIPDEPV